MPQRILSSEFLQYLADTTLKNGDGQLPSLSEISAQLGISVARLREQLEVAKALGLVDVHPRTGMRLRPYSFSLAIWQILSYGLKINPALFQSFSDLRDHVEAAYWDLAVRRLGPEEYAELRSLISRAWEKLRGNPIQIPHSEHRQLHLCIFRKLDNLFVYGILEGYWQAYEEIGLNLYADYGYLEQVWTYHQQIVDAICSGDYETGYRAMIKHKDLMHFRPARIAEPVSHPLIKEQL